MGYMTLANFETDVQSALGNRGIASPNVDRWINFGYISLAGAVMFPELTEEDTAQATAGGQNYINVPTGALLVQIVRTDAYRLDWVHLPEYWRYAQTIQNAPVRWARQQSKILLHPVPVSAVPMRVTYIKSPTRLVGAADVTVLPDMWDAAIFYLAVSHGLLALGEEGRSVVWFQTATNYIATRLTESQLVASVSGLGPSLPNLAEGK